MEITISYNDILSKKNLNNEIKNAFGLNGLGIILIKDLPVFECERLNILSSIKKFAELPDNIKSKYIDSKSNYSFGWSHGKEKMKKNEFDKSKGSFYNNIGTNCNENQNIWPDEIPDFKEKLNKMASLQIRIGLEISKLLDNYLFDITNGIHKKNTFYNLLEKNNNFKARALHYFPCENEKNIDNLCGWHLDHGCITTLLSPIYFSNNFNKINNINDKDGLYIKTQAGDGGMITTDNKEIMEKIKKLYWFGIESTYNRTKIKDNPGSNSVYKWQYDIDILGYKYYMIDLTAALGLSQMEKLDENLKRRQFIQEKYNNAFNSIDEITLPPFSYTVQHYVIKVSPDKRDKLIDYLKDKNIHTSVHYRPLHLFTQFRDKTNFPVADREWLRMITLPVHLNMTDDDIEYVIYWVKKFKL